MTAFFLLVALILGCALAWRFIPLRSRGFAIKTAAALCFYGGSIYISCVLASLPGAFEANVFFGTHNKRLIDACVEAMEAGDCDRAAAALKDLRKVYRPSYDNRANWKHLVDQAVAQMKGPQQGAPLL